MQGAARAMILGSLLAGVQCSEANAPIADTPTAQPRTAEPPFAGLSGRLAFVTEIPGGLGGFAYVVNADGSGLRQLPGGQAYYSKPRWSPDGRRIVVGRTVPNPLSSSVIIIDVDGQAGITTLAAGTHPAWSPDGSKIAFSATGTGSDVGIHVMDADGRNVRRLTSPNDPSQCREGEGEGSSASDWKADWSPDGRKILFERQVHTSETGYDCGLDGWGYIPFLWLMNVDGTGLRQVMASSSDPAWSPDGRFIAYSIIQNGLYVIDSEGTGPRRRIDLPYLNARYPLNPAWSPDGKKLLFLAVDPPNNKLAVVDLESGAAGVFSFPTVSGAFIDAAWSR